MKMIKLVMYNPNVTEWNVKVFKFKTDFALSLLANYLIS